MTPSPCPFCNGKNISVVEGTTFRWRHVNCDECGANGPEVRIQTVGEGTKEQWEERAIELAIVQWNLRISNNL